MVELAKYFDDLTNSEKVVFNYIYNHQKEVIDMKINDLAREALTSKTVIINMAQKLGFLGYADFKYYLKSGNIPKKNKNKYEELENELKDNIQKTFSLVNIEDIKGVVREIQKARTIYIAARGTSKAVGSHLNHLLLTLGIRCIFLEDYNLTSIVSRTLDINEIVILISLSGKTEKILEVANIAKLRKAKVISITCFDRNSLSNIADYKLYCASQGSDTKINDSISRIGMFLIVEMIVAMLKDKMT